MELWRNKPPSKHALLKGLLNAIDGLKCFNERNNVPGNVLLRNVATNLSSCTDLRIVQRCTHTGIIQSNNVGDANEQRAALGLRKGGLADLDLWKCLEF